MEKTIMFVVLFLLMQLLGSTSVNAQKKIKCDLSDYMLRATYTNWVKNAAQETQVTRVSLKEKRLHLETLLIRLTMHITSFSGRAADLVELKAIYMIYKDRMNMYLRGKGKILASAIDDIEKHVTVGEGKLIVIKRLLQKLADLIKQREDIMERLREAMMMWTKCVKSGVLADHLCDRFHIIENSLNSLGRVADKFAEELVEALREIFDCLRKVIKMCDILSVLDYLYNTLGRALPSQLPRVLGIWIRSELNTVKLLKQLSRDIAFSIDELGCFARHTFQNTLLSVRCTYEDRQTTSKTTESTARTTKDKTTTTTTTTATTTSPTTTSPSTTSPTTTTPTTTSPSTTSPTTSTPTTTSPSTTSPTTSTPTSTSPSTTSPTTTTPTTTSTTTPTTTSPTTTAGPVLSLYADYIVYMNYPRGVDLEITYESLYWYIAVRFQVMDLNTHGGSGCSFANSDAIVFPNSDPTKGGSPYINRQCGTRPRDNEYHAKWVDRKFQRLQMRFVAGVGKVGGFFKVKVIIGKDPKWTISNGGSTRVVDKSKEKYRP